MTAYDYLRMNGWVSARMVQSGDFLVSFQPPRGERLTCITRPGRDLTVEQAREKAARVIVDRLESEGHVIHMDEL